MSKSDSFESSMIAIRLHLTDANYIYHDINADIVSCLRSLKSVKKELDYLISKTEEELEAK